MLVANNYGLLITGGLGSSALNIITAKFGLCFCIKVEIKVEPESGGIISGSAKKRISIVVRYQHSDWRASYPIDARNEKWIISVLNMINNTTNKLSVGINMIHTNKAKVMAIFTNKDSK